MDVLKFLRAKGFSEEEMYKDLKADGFGSSPSIRDEFGLPHGVSMKSNVGSKPISQDVPVVFDDLSKKNSEASAPNPFKDKLKGKVQDEDPVMEQKTEVNLPPKTTWSNVVKNSSVVPPLEFDYH